MLLAFLLKYWLVSCEKHVGLKFGQLGEENICQRGIVERPQHLVGTPGALNPTAAPNS